MEDQELCELLDQIDRKVNALRTDVSFLFESFIQLARHVDSSLLQHIDIIEQFRPLVPVPKAKKRERIQEQVEAERVCHLYGDYEALSIAAGGSELQRVNPQLPVVDQLLYRKLDALAARSAITFAPVVPEKDDRRVFRVLFLAGVPVGELHALPADTLIVETGTYRCDAHIPLREGLLAAEVTIAQRMLCGLYETDRGSIDADCQRQLPGFGSCRLRDDIRPTGPQVCIAELERILRDQVTRQEAAAPGYRPAKECWLDFFCHDRDASDRAYAEYLYGEGFSPDEIRCALVAESEDLYIRHMRALREYLDRTIRAAAIMTLGDRALAALGGGVKRNGSQ